MGDKVTKPETAANPPVNPGERRPGGQAPCGASTRARTADTPTTFIDYLALDDQALLRLCEVDTYRARGPGGQKRNKTDSAVRLRLTGSDLMVIATESRSQYENRARALRRMRQAIALETRRPLDRDSYRISAVTRGCVTPGSQLRVGRRDSRYDRVVSEVLDVIAACDVRLSEAAALIGVTTANLTTFLRKDAKLLDRVNRMRRDRGLKTIR